MDEKGWVAQVHTRSRKAAGVYAEQEENEKASDAVDPLELTMRDISKSFLGGLSQHESSEKRMQAITK